MSVFLYISATSIPVSHIIMQVCLCCVFLYFSWLYVCVLYFFAMTSKCRMFSTWLILLHYLLMNCFIQNYYMSILLSTNITLWQLNFQDNAFVFKPHIFPALQYKCFIVYVCVCVGRWGDFTYSASHINVQFIRLYVKDTPHDWLRITDVIDLRYHFILWHQTIGIKIPVYQFFPQTSAMFGLFFPVSLTSLLWNQVIRMSELPICWDWAFIYFEYLWAVNSCNWVYILAISQLVNWCKSCLLKAPALVFITDRTYLFNMQSRNVATHINMCLSTQNRTFE